MAFLKGKSHLVGRKLHTRQRRSRFGLVSPRVGVSHVCGTEKLGAVRPVKGSWRCSAQWLG